MRQILRLKIWQWERCFSQPNPEINRKNWLNFQIRLCKIMSIFANESVASALLVDLVVKKVQRYVWNSGVGLGFICWKKILFVTTKGQCYIFKTSFLSYQSACQIFRLAHLVLILSFVDCRL